MTFSQPGSVTGDNFTPADHNGALLLIYPKNYQDEVQTRNGASSAAEVDIVVVDRPGPDGRPQFFQSARLFGNLARSVRNDLGGQVLGRLGQGPNTRGTPPWILLNFTDADAAMATPAHQQYQQGLFKPKENPMQQPQQAAPQQSWQPPATQTAYAPQTQGTPPPQQWSAPPAPQAAAPAPVPATPAGAVDPNLAAFLQSRGVNPAGMSQQQAEAIAVAFPA